MIINLETRFTEDEKIILNTFVQENQIEIHILYNIDDKKLNGISNPNRIIFVGGLYLCEEKDELSSWYMGQKIKEIYDFWGNYGILQEALNGL